METIRVQKADLLAAPGYKILPHRFHCGSDPFWAGQVPKPYGELGASTWPRGCCVSSGNAHRFMYLIGVIEIVAGILVAIKPRWGAYIVALWLRGNHPQPRHVSGLL